MKHVFIVDDRVHEIDRLARMLRDDLGCQVTLLTNEKDTRDHFQSFQIGAMPYALAIIDIMIPVAKLKDLITLDEEYLKNSLDTGIRLCTFLRKELGITAEALPIIAISARADDELIQQLNRLKIPLFSRADLGIRDYLNQLLG